MTRYTDGELRDLLEGGESDRVEFKAAWTRPVAPKARETVCAFANDLTGTGRAGVLIVGARDDGSPSGISVDDLLLLQLNEMRTDGNIVPPPSMYVERRVLDSFQYALVAVEPSDSPPVRYDKRIHVRTGPRRDIATAQDERILSERFRFRNFPDDAHPVPTAGVDAINKRRFEYVYLPAAFAEDVLAANERTYEQRLSALRLITTTTPVQATVAGCLALVDDATWHIPGAYIQWLRIKGIDLSDPKIDALEGKGDIAEAIRSIDSKLQGFCTTEVDYGTTPLERRFSLYPLAALKELLRNAVMHRRYGPSNTPIHVYWYDDRIEIRSPGGPYGEVNVDNFGQPGLAAYRNPTLAEAMKVLELVQRFGTGISYARSLCAANGNPPIEFEVTQNFVTAIVRPAVRLW